eukprot:6483400-Amphidinium_carterae.1
MGSRSPGQPATAKVNNVRRTFFTASMGLVSSSKGILLVRTTPSALHLHVLNMRRSIKPTAGPERRFLRLLCSAKSLTIDWPFINNW